MVTKMGEFDQRPNVVELKSARLLCIFRGTGINVT